MTLCSLIDSYQHFGRICYFLVSWRQIVYRVTEELAASFFRVQERLFSAEGDSWFFSGFGIKPICQTTCHMPVDSISLKHITVFYLHLLLDSCLLVLLYVNTVHYKT